MDRSFLKCWHGDGGIGEGEGDVQGVEAVHDAEVVQGTQWTKWTICDRALTRAVLRQAGDIFYIIFNIDFIYTKII